MKRANRVRVTERNLSEHISQENAAYREIIRKKMMRYPNGAPMFDKTGMMLDDQGNRSIFDDVDE